jgi:hypothetical protein
MNIIIRIIGWVMMVLAALADMTPNQAQAVFNIGVALVLLGFTIRPQKRGDA